MSEKQNRSMMRFERLHTAACEVARRLATASTSEGIAEERGPSEGQTKVVARGRFLAYSFTSRKSQGVPTDTEDDAPSSGGSDKRKNGGRN